MTKLLRRDHSGGNAGIRVCCLACGRMVILSEAAIDREGPAFRAYYHDACAEMAFGSVEFDSEKDTN